MDNLLFVFIAVYLLNTLPAFAPPTWMFVSFIGFNNGHLDPLTLALVAAVAATLGRISLSLLSRSIIRNRLLSEKIKQNIGALKDVLEQRQNQTSGALLAYSFTPFPTNYLFIAFGLSALPIRLIALPFFIGRLASYSAWGFLGQQAYQHIQAQGSFFGGYLSAYFIVTQIIFLLLIYPFAKIDWHALLIERQFRWLK